MSELNQSGIKPWIFHENITLKPIGQRVVVEPEPMEVTTKSGLILPEADRTRPLVARVISSGTAHCTC